jgi:hypothetical protein
MTQQFRNVTEAPQAGVAYRCPCCKFKTLSERGGDAICPVWFWEDDGRDDHDSDEVRGGPNRLLSLSNARDNFLQFGACDAHFITKVRKPLPDEL